MPTKWDLTMIKLEKSTTIPSSLATYGPEKAAGLIKRADSGDSNFKSEDFSHKIYADAQLKAQLIEDQHGKCAYCERKKGGDFGAVEHYRPKAGYQVSTKSKLIKPGYYWLAYEWNNLLYSCDECNTTYKRNLFPLLDENARNISGRNIDAEVPGIINPYFSNPSEHLVFNQYVVKPRNVGGQEDKQGRITIDSLGLDKNQGLINDRRNAWEEYKNIELALKIAKEINSQEMIEAVSNILAEYTSPSHEFSGMFTNQE